MRGSLHQVEVQRVFCDAEFVLLLVRAVAEVTEEVGADRSRAVNSQGALCEDVA